MKKFTSKDTTRTMYDEVPDKIKGNEGMVCVIPYEKLNKGYRKPEYQLFRVLNGFGIYPDRMGNACYGIFCIDGEHCRWEKFNFIGVGNDEVQKIGNELEKTWKKDI